MNEPPNAVAPAFRKLGLVACASLVVGNMVGSGIFLLPASLAPYGSFGLAGWAVTVTGAICLALVFARLAAARPAAGGPYAYVRAGYGDFAGFWVAWGYWISIWSANAAIAVAFVSYLKPFVPAMAASNRLCGFVAIAAVWLLTAVNARGIQSGATVQVVTTALKLVPLAALAFAGIFLSFKGGLPPPSFAGKSPGEALSAVVALTLWSFLGLEAATIPAGEVRDAARTIPRATIVGTLLAASLYVLSTVAVMALVPGATLAASAAPFADAARVLAGSVGAWVVGAGAVISCFGALNGWTLVVGQMPLAASRDGLFPAFFQKMNRHGVPAAGMFVSSAIASLLLVFQFSGTKSLVAIFDLVILLSTLACLVPYVFCALVPLLPSFRASERLAPRGGPLVAIAAFVYSVFAVWGAGAETALYGFVLFLLGLPVWIWLKRESEAGPALRT